MVTKISRLCSIWPLKLRRKWGGGVGGGDHRLSQGSHGFWTAPNTKNNYKGIRETRRPMGERHTSSCPSCSSPYSFLHFVTFDLIWHWMASYLSYFDIHKYNTMISGLNNEKHWTKGKNEYINILTLTFLTLTFTYSRNNRIIFILGVLFPSRWQNAWLMCIIPNMPLTLIYMTLPLTQSYIMSTI